MSGGARFFATAVALTVCGGAAFAPAPQLHPPLHGASPGPLGAVAPPAAPAAAVDRAVWRRRGAGPRRPSLEGAGAADTLAPPMPERRQSAPGTSQRIVFKGLTTTVGRRGPLPPPTVAELTAGASRDPATVAGGSPAAPLNATRAPLFRSRRDTAHYVRSGDRRARRPELRTGPAAAVEAPVKHRQRGQNKRSRMSQMYRNSPNVPDSMVDFTEQIHRYALLTAEEETMLGERVQEAIRLHRLYDALEAQLAREPTEEEWCAAAGKADVAEIRHAMETGRLAKDRLVVSNLRLVQKVVNVYLRIGLSPHYNAADLMQAGVMALIRAAERFEPKRGCRFSTYSLYWIRSAVKRAEMEQRGIIKFPQNVLRLSRKVVRFERDVYSAVGMQPTRQEICAALDISEEMLDQCYQALSSRTYSLDEPLKSGSKNFRDEGKGATLLDVIDGQELDQGNFRYDRDRLRDDMVRNMQRFLKPEEIELLLLRYGIKAGAIPMRPQSKNGCASYTDLSTIFGLSPGGAKKRIDRSLDKLKVMKYEEWSAYL